MIYCITDRGVLTGRNFKDFNNKHHMLLEETECVAVGADLVCNCTDADIDFLQDKAKVSNIMFGNFFRKDNSVKIFAVINLVFTCMILFFK